MPIEREKIRNALVGKGFKEKSGRTHDNYYLYIAGKKSKIFTHLSHGSGYKDYTDELVNKVYHQIGLVKREFLEFIDCPLTHQKHIALLRQRNLIR